MNYGNKHLALQSFAALMLLSCSPDYEKQNDSGALEKELTMDDATTDNLILLDDQQIRNLIVGKAFAPTESSSWRPFSEMFLEDGTWKASYQMRGLTVVSGNWSISNKQICVTLSQKDAQTFALSRLNCRSIWKQKADDTFKIVDLLAGGKSVFVKIDGGK